MHIGFTGTRDGMSQAQVVAFTDLFTDLSINDVLRFGQGCCVGADEQATRIVKEAMGHRAWIIGYQPEIKTHVSQYCLETSDELRDPKPYLDRNKDLVDDCSLLIGAVRGDEELRSGTWSTIRYAKKTNRDYAIIYPNGVIVERLKKWSVSSM